MMKSEIKRRLDYMRRLRAQRLAEGRYRPREAAEIRRNIQALDAALAAVSAVVFGQVG